MSELKHCPFCGGEAKMSHEVTCGYETFWIHCLECHSQANYGHTEAEAIAAWNSRAPIEYEGWFYLPKPKDGIVDYGEPEMTRTENGYKVRQIIDVVDEAARKWGDDLNEYIMRRICEAWNTRAELTCKVESCTVFSYDFSPEIYYEFEMQCGVSFDWNDEEPPSHCPNCGAHVTKSDQYLAQEVDE